MAKESELSQSPDLSGGEGKPVNPEPRSSQRKVQVSFALALLCFGVVGWVSYLDLLRLNENTAWVEHTHEVLDGLESLIGAAADSEAAERGYVITGDETYLDRYRLSAQRIGTEATSIRRLTSDNSMQQRRLDSLAALLDDRLANLRLVIELRRDKGFEAAKSEILTGNGRRFHDQVRGLVDEMTRT
jgi:methyl-accepting chemotaxis protein